MIKLNFPLSISLHSPRPIFVANINGINMKCMLDTGADIPVFCKGVDLFKELTKQIKGVSKYKESFISGFGESVEVTTLWNFDVFKLNDRDKNFIAYHGLKVAVLEKPNIPCDIILSSSMFMKMRYTIDCLSDEPFLKVYADKQIYGVGFNQQKDTIYIFANEHPEQADLAASFNDYINNK